MTETDNLLSLVRRALDEFEDVPLAVSVRRSLRIAMHRGDTDEAWFARQDLRPLGGSGAISLKELRTISHNLNETTIASRHRELFENWLDERTPSIIPDEIQPYFSSDGSGNVIPGSVDDLERRIKLREGPWMQGLTDLAHQTTMQMRIEIDREILGRISLRTYMYLCRCETELTFTSTSASIFDRHKNRVDRYLVDLAPEILSKLNASYHSALDGDPERLSQALLSCRRVLLAVADIVCPARDEPVLDDDGKSHGLTRENYRNRLIEFLRQSLNSNTSRKVIQANLSDLATRINKVDELNQKGVHENVTQEEADMCVIQTYLITGEILSIYETNSQSEDLQESSTE